MADTDVSARVRHLVEAPLAESGFELVDVDRHGSVLRVSIDRPGGIDLDAIADASRVVSEILDRHDVVPGGRYTLEVSSPGVERPLRTPEHFQRFVGTPVAVKTKPGTDGDRRVDGVLDAADDHGIVVDGRAIPYDRIERARTRFEWGPSPSPKKGKTSAGRGAR